MKVENSMTIKLFKQLMKFDRKLQEQVSHPAGEVAGKSEYLLKVKIMATHYMIYEYVLLQFEKLLLVFDTSRYVAVIG